MLKLKRLRKLRVLSLLLFSMIMAGGFQNCSPLKSSDFSASSSSNTGPMDNEPAPGVLAWRDLKVGAGGFLTGIDIAPDGTMVVRTDTYGAYLWNGAKWLQLVNATSMPANELSQQENGTGVFEIKIAPSNTQIFYMMFKGKVYKSTNRGATWTPTAFAKVGDDANYELRGNAQKMAVDPINPNVVYVGTTQNGMFVTSDGGASFQSVSSVPVGLKSGNSFPGITGILFDPQSGSTGGKTNTIYASSGGMGVYRSTNAGASWSLVPGSSTTAVSGAAISNGIYYSAGGTEVYKIQNGTGSRILDNGGNGAIGVAVDPNNAQRIVVTTPGGNLNLSVNGGSTWAGINWNQSAVATDIPWLSSSITGAFLCVGGFQWDPKVPSKLWISAGVAVWNVTLPANYTGVETLTWNSQTLGIEQLVADDMVVPPGGKPVLASWDRPFFRIEDPHAYPTTYSPIASQQKIVAGWSIDYASSNPSFLVGLADWWGEEHSGYSSDGGKTWTKFPTMIPGASSQFMGGTIAASTPSNIIWAPADSFQPYYTLDGGNSWKLINLPGVTDWTGFHWAYYLFARTVTADRVNPNTFYLFFATKGLFKTTDGGVSWTKIFNGDISPFDGYNAKLLSVPEHAGHLFFTGGPQSGTHPANESFMRSVDGGVTWTAVPNVLEVTSFGFGKAKNAGGYPAIFIAGYVNGDYGIWQSDDNAQSWTKLGTWPDGHLDSVKTIAGDPNQYGVVYVGFSGSGYKYYGY